MNSNSWYWLLFLRNYKANASNLPTISMSLHKILQPFSKFGLKSVSSGPWALQRKPQNQSQNPIPRCRGNRLGTERSVCRTLYAILPLTPTTSEQHRCHRRWQYCDRWTRNEHRPQCRCKPFLRCILPLGWDMGTCNLFLDHYIFYF